MREQVLGVDWGAKRVGIATAELGTHVVTPLCVLEGEPEQVYVELKDLVRRQGVSRVVVGVPYRRDGSPSEVTAAAQGFASRLRQESGVMVVTQDERLSTRAAAAQQREAGRGGRAETDALAAADILSRYLDRLASGTFV